ncbi:MAG: hypothetical protein H7Y88_08485 [Phycisphaerales bacterium]|nr:hypothetical protein [Phycisphaerales bacterium]
MAKKSARSRRQGKSEQWGATRVWQVLATTGTALIMLGILGGATLGRSAMQQTVAGLKAAELKKSHRPGISPDFDWPTTVGGGKAISWLDPETQARLKEIVTSTVTIDPFDTGSLVLAQKRLMDTGWFRSPVVLKRERLSTIKVEGRFRVPFAAVRCGDRDHLVTSRSELLDKSYPPGASSLRVITGAGEQRPAGPGHTWPTADVQAGLDLLDFIRNVKGFERVVAIDVSAFDQGRRQLMIVTASGVRILWGGPHDEFLPGEERPANKLAMLPRVLEAAAAGNPNELAGYILDARTKSLGWQPAP